MRRPKIATYYARLKVAQDAPPEVLRAAYKALVQKYHPDRHHGSVRHEIVLAALNKAHDVLSDPARRAAHDAWIREEEVRLGWREPDGMAQEPGFGTRLRQVLWSVRDDALPLPEALRLHLTRRQRAALLLAATGAVAVLVGAGFHLMREDDDPLRRLGPLAPAAPALGPAAPALGPAPVAYSAPASAPD